MSENLESMGAKTEIFQSRLRNPVPQQDPPCPFPERKEGHDRPTSPIHPDSCQLLSTSTPPLVAAPQEPTDPFRLGSINIQLIGPEFEPPKEQLAAPNRESLFESIHEVQLCLRYILQRNRFVAGKVKRAILDYISYSKAESEGLLPAGRKPSALYVEEMFYACPDLFKSGETPLEPGMCPFHLDAIKSFHKESCNKCSPLTAKEVHPQCYITPLIRCLTHGWEVTTDISKITPAYAADGNYKSASSFEGSILKEIVKMESKGIIRRCEASRADTGIVNPVGAVIKNSEITRARTTCGQPSINNEEELARINSFYEERQQPKCKVRMVTDCTQPGINGSSLIPPFSYTTIEDTCQMIDQGDWLAKTDLERFFFAFPISIFLRLLFLIKICEQLYEYLRCCFGYGPCPYYCSTWSAEYRRWINARGIPCSHMVDDWLTKGRTKEEAASNLSALRDIFTSIGHTTSVEKEELGQEVVFTGILFNSVNMSMSIDATQATGTCAQLKEITARIMSGRDVDPTTIRSIAGKLNWFAELIQAGRCHIRIIWVYFKLRHRLSPAGRLKLIKDLQWWTHQMEAWAIGSLTGREYRILNSRSLVKDQHSIYIVRSDASCTDGYGYFGGWIGSRIDESTFTSVRWPSVSKISSHAAELTSLSHSLENLKHQPQMLIWLTDCLSAAWSVNKGGCHEDRGYDLIEKILEECDTRKLIVLALWIPREKNILADYLSHLAVYMDRDEVSGSVSELPPHLHHL